MELRLRLATSGQRHIGSPQIFGSFRRRRQKPYPHFATKAALFLSKLSIPEFLTTLLSHALAFTHSHLGFYQQFLVRITVLTNTPRTAECRTPASPSQPPSRTLRRTTGMTAFTAGCAAMRTAFIAGRRNQASCTAHPRWPVRCRLLSGGDARDSRRIPVFPISARVLSGGHTSRQPQAPRMISAELVPPNPADKLIAYRMFRS